MPPIATDVTAAARAGPSVCVSVTLVHPAKAVERNEMSHDMWSKWSSCSPRNAKGHLRNSRRSEEIFRGKGGKGVQGLDGLFDIAVFVN